MRGTPHYLNTKADYVYLCTNFSADLWRPRFQTLLDNRMAWLNVGTLTAADAGVTDEMHRVDEITGEPGMEKKRYQFEYMEDPNCKLLRLGFTPAEIEVLL